jgi:hypothetical protein
VIGREGMSRQLIKSIVLLTSLTYVRAAWAADFAIIPESMVYNVDTSEDEYLALVFDNKNKTILECRSLYKLSSNLLSSEGCRGAVSLPFSLSFADALSARSTIIFTRAANRQGQAVFGPNGIWQLDEKNGAVEFCVFGDVTPKCVVLNPG